MSVAALHRRGTPWGAVAWAGAIAAALLAALVVSVGSLEQLRLSIDLYLAGLALATVLVPCLSAAEDDRVCGLLAGGAVVDGIALFWLFSVVGGPVGWGAWLGCYAILAAVAAAQWSWTRLLGRLVGRTVAAAGVAVLSLAWLAWPIWLSVHLSGTTPGLTWLVRLHPGLALNTLLRTAFGVWTEQPFAYRLTNLNQDVPYALPHPAWCIGACLILAAIPFAIALWMPRMRRPARR